MSGLAGLSGLSGSPAVYGGMAPWAPGAPDNFTPWMAQRPDPGPFDYGAIYQGRMDGTGIGDQVTVPRGDLLGNATGRWYANFDPYQGTFVMWLTPEWDGNDGLIHTIKVPCVDPGIFYLIKDAGNFLQAYIGGGFATGPSVAAWTAGTTYCVIFRWDSKRPLDGTNHGCWTVDTVDTFGRTAYVANEVPLAAMHFGTNVAGENSLDSIVAGFTIYRRVLYDGTYGTDVGNGDELTAIYAAGAGLDPCRVTGAWDIVFAKPTNQDGTVLQNTMQAWSMRHALSLPDGTFMSKGGYLCEPHMVEYDGATTSTNCGSNPALDNWFRQPSGKGEATLEAWIRADSWGESDFGGYIAEKVGGWVLYLGSAGDRGLYAVIRAAGTNAVAGSGQDAFPEGFNPDGKGHHVVMYFQELADGGDGDIYLALDGHWGTTYEVRSTQVGAIDDDSAGVLFVGNNAGGTGTHDGGIGWMAAWSDDHYNHGVDFVAPRAPPAPGGNLIECWPGDEGTGTTLTATVNPGVPPGGCNGTIVNGGWSSTWEFEGTPVIPQSVYFVGDVGEMIHFGSGVNIDDLFDSPNGGTYEGYFAIDVAQNGRLIRKGGMQLLEQASGTQVQASVQYAGANASVVVNFRCDDRVFHHYAMCHRTIANGGDGRTYLFIGGVLMGFSAVGGGAIVADATSSLAVMNVEGGSQPVNGRVGWVRCSSTVRYTGTTAGQAYFIPPGRTNPPGNDAMAQLLANMDDGAGLIVTDTSGNGYNGTITFINAASRWWNTPDMESEEPGARRLGWGLNIGSDGVDDGITIIEDVQVVAETDYVLRPIISVGESGRAQPELYVYDNIGAAQIGATFRLPQFVGVHTGGMASATLINANGRFTQQMVGWTVHNVTDGSSGVITAVSGDKTTITAPLGGGAGNVWDTNDDHYIRPPGNQNYCQHPHATEGIYVFRTPSGCTSIDIKIRNHAGEGVMQIHQCEVYESLLDNGDIEAVLVGVPPLPPGWSNSGLDAGDTQAEAVVIHAGAQSWEWNPGATAGEHAYMSLVTVAVGEYVLLGGWFYGEANEALGLTSSTPTRGVLQYSLTLYTVPNDNVVAWQHLAGVWRRMTGLLRAGVYSVGNTAVGDRFVDDVYAVLLNAVNLTVTPASEPNSQESGGTRVDGLDAANDPIPVGRLLATEGWIRQLFRPRHDAAQLVAFDVNGTGGYAWGDATNYIRWYATAANNIRLEFNDGGGIHVVNWNCTGLIVADTLYVVDTRYTPGRMQLIFDGVPVAEIVQPVNFVTVPMVLYQGHEQAGLNHIDAVFA